MIASFDNPKTPGLRFNSNKDALHLGALVAKDLKYWLSVNNLDPVKRYIDLEVGS